jgi:O-antigen/teichoic acid export membrane protein
LGPILVTLLLGEKYAALVPILTWLAILQGLRILKGGPSTVALARGQTENALVANLLRVALLPLAWWVVQQEQNLSSVLILGILGEFLGAIVAFGLVRWRLQVQAKPLLLPMTLTLFAMLAAGLYGWGLIGSTVSAIPAPWTNSLAIILQVAAALAMKPLWLYVAGKKRDLTS